MRESNPVLTLVRTGTLALTAIGLTVASGSAQATTELRGQLIEAGTGTPLGGVMVGAPDAGLHVLTGAQGYFSFPEIEPGPHRIVIDVLGYAPVDRSFAFSQTAPLIVALQVQPISLEAIEVEVERLDRRRQNVGTSSFIFTDRDLEARLEDAATFLRGRGQMRPIHCEWANGCFINRGQKIAAFVFMDDTRAAGGYDFLSGIPPEVIARIETYPACGMVRVYTKRHLERLAERGGQLLPFRCRRERVR